MCVCTRCLEKKIVRTQEMLNISARRANDTEHAEPENIKEKQYNEKKENKGKLGHKKDETGNATSFRQRVTLVCTGEKK